MRRKANDSSGCRVPHVTGVRYRRDSVSIRDYVIGGEYFPNPGNTRFLMHSYAGKLSEADLWVNKKPYP